MDLMNGVFRNYLKAFVIIFMYDNLVYSKNEGECMYYLRLLLQVLKEHQQFSKYIKFEFWLILVEFAFRVISSEGVDVDSNKTKAVRNWPRSLSLIDIRIFLVLTRYYRRFIEGFVSIASLLTTLTQKNVKF